MFSKYYTVHWKVVRSGASSANRMEITHSDMSSAQWTQSYCHWLVMYYVYWVITFVSMLFLNNYWLDLKETFVEHSIQRCPYHLHVRVRTFNSKFLAPYGPIWTWKQDGTWSWSANCIEPDLTSRSFRLAWLYTIGKGRSLSVWSRCIRWP